MVKSSLLLGFFLLLGLASPAEFKGLRPHVSRADYAVTCFTESIGVAATLVRPEQIRRLFGAEIEHLACTGWNSSCFSRVSM